MTIAVVPVLSGLLAAGLAIGVAVRDRRRAGTGAAPADAAPAISLAGDRDMEATSLRLILEHGSDVLMRLDAHWNRLFVSPSCREVFGENPLDVLITPALSLVHPEDRPAVRAILSGLVDGAPPVRAVWRGLHHDGRVLWIEATYRRVVADGGAVVIMRDITQRKTAEDRLAETRARLEHMSLIDPLTGLPNRDAFLDTAGAMLTGGASLALWFIDLHRFRQVNDTHGHITGDGVLREVAARLSQVLAHEPLVARLRSDKFAVLTRLPNGDPGLSAQARDVIRAIAEPMHPGEAIVRIGASIGLTVAPRDAEDVMTLLRNAELAAGRAKQSGGDTYRFYEPAMGEAAERAAILKQTLPRAIRDGEIVPWFQPLVRLETMELAGYEILARWEHPAFGPLSPEDFMPLAQDIGVLPELRATVLSGAFEASRDWPPGTLLTLNLSAAELCEETLPASLASAMSKAAFDPMRLEIDVTEQSLTEAPHPIRGMLEALRGMGISLALDDFGTGLSSLRLLRDLPLDKVKIDRSFMHGLARDPACERHVGALVTLCQTLGLEVTAEGIEDEGSLARLQAMGCTYGQGHVFQPPVPARALRGLAWRRDLMAG